MIGTTLFRPISKVAVLALAAAVALAGMLFLPGEVSADNRMDLHCYDGWVVEGDDQRVKVQIEEHDHWVQEAVWWYTEVGTADESDYTPLHGHKQVFSGEEHSDERLYRNIHTTEDDYSEFIETFNLRIGNQSNRSNRTSCTITILDDDGIGVYETEITSTPADGHTYRLGEFIEITMRHTSLVWVIGEVGIGLGVGRPSEDYDRYRLAGYHSGSGSDTLVYRYQVKPGDFDNNGIRVEDGSGGRYPTGLYGSGHIESRPIISGSGSPEDINPNYRGLPSDQPGHNVDGTVRVTEVELVSTPANGDTYRKGEEILIDVTFSAPVDALNNPAVSLWFDGTGESVWKPARYKSGTGTETLRFAREVSSDDLDATGLTIGAKDWDGLGTGKVRLAGTNVNANHSYEAQRELSGHKVDGRMVVAVTGVGVVSSPVHQTGYRSGETIELEVTFDAQVTATSAAGLKLSLGNRTVTALYSGGADAPASETIRFAYKVQPGDIDGNGLTIPAMASDGLGSGAVATSNGSNVNHSFAAQEDLAGQLVDGDAHAKSVEVVSSPTSDDAYLEGEVIRVRVPFDQELGVEGEVSISLQVGGQVRTAWFDSSGDLITYSPEFTYTVQADDFDGGGIEILDGFGGDGFIFGQVTLSVLGTIRPVVFVNPTPGALPGHRVGERPYVTSVEITAGPSDGATYGAGENIEVTMTFSQEVDAHNNPGIRLLVGPNGSQWVESLRVARYKSGSGANSIVFSYQVQDSDSDADGVTLDIDQAETGWGLHDFRGGKIYASGTTTTVSERFPVEMYSVTSYNVEGSSVSPAPVADETAPTISSIAITSDPGDDDDYGIGDSIDVTVTFSEDVTVTGVPQLELDFDGTAKTAAYSSANGAEVVFSYTVALRDSGSEGVAIGANKLSLNGGAIQDEAANSATLTHAAVAADSGHKVDNPFDNLTPGTTDITAPTISSIAVTSDPGDDYTYGAGDIIRVTVTFSEDVVVTGIPQLELEFYDPGSANQQASFESVNGAEMVFVYTVEAGDSASDGLSIQSNKLTLNGGAIQDSAGNDAALTHSAYGPDADHFVRTHGGL